MSVCVKSRLPLYTYTPNIFRILSDIFGIIGHFWNIDVCMSQRGACGCPKAIIFTLQYTLCRIVVILSTCWIRCSFVMSTLWNSMCQVSRKLSTNGQTNLIIRCLRVLDVGMSLTDCVAQILLPLLPPHTDTF